MLRYARVLYRTFKSGEAASKPSADEPVVRAAIEHMREGTERLWNTFAQKPAPPDLRELCRIVASYTARYWVKSFEKATDAAICAEIIKQQRAGRLEILDVGSGSGEMIKAIIAACGRECWIDGFDNMAEHDTSREIFLTHKFARDFIIGDFNALPHSLGRYDVILGMNSVRMANDLPSVVKALASHLKPGGRLIINTITPRFQERFFAACYEIANKAGVPSKRFETAANYIPNAYMPEQLAGMLAAAGLAPDVREYLFETDFPIYSYFPVGYQFLYPYARHAIPLSMADAHSYGIVYADFVYTLANTLPAFTARQVEQWRSGERAPGLHNMAVGRMPD
mgnify:CR=1 FL=1